MKKTETDPNWSFLRPFPIRDETTGDLYLWRLRVLETPWWGIKLHWIRRPDKDRDLHDHPWPFVSFILFGAYVEEVPAKPERDKSGWWLGTKQLVKSRVSVKRAEDAHRIVAVSRLGAWTLVFNGKKQRSWGFWTKDGWRAWREYLGVKS